MSRFEGLKNREELRNLKISDDEYLSDAKRYLKIGKELDRIYKEYLKELQDFSNDLDGHYAENMGKFCQRVQMYLGDVILELIKRLNREMKSYIKDIDDADGKLF